MNDKYDPDNDSPEVRANFATRGIFNVVERKRRRNELLKKFREETVVDMFPKSNISSDLEAIQTELTWFQAEPLKDHQFSKVCQCGTEDVIRRSSDSNRMRASLLCLTFFDQFVYSHYPQVHAEFRTEFPVPKLMAHSFGGHASPSWLIYSRHGFDEDANWELISATFVNCIRHLRRWLRHKLDRPVPELKQKVEQEIVNEFEPQHRSNFSAPIGS